MKYTALIGNPVDHSVSPVMYEALVSHFGLSSDFRHIKIKVDSQDLTDSLDALKTLQFIGVNVTLPYKIAIMQHLDKIDLAARDLGAINTIKLGDKTTGFNTDWQGITESVKLIAPDRILKKAVVFGSGGAARAAIYACKKLGCKEVNALFRSDLDDSNDVRKELAALDVKAHPYNDVGRLVGSADLVINATSTGMVGNDPYPFPIDLLNTVDLSKKVYFDAVFNPVETPLLKYFARGGATTIDGLWMMIFQGVHALSIWFDRELPIEISSLETIHELLVSELKKEHNA